MTNSEPTESGAVDSPTAVATKPEGGGADGGGVVPAGEGEGPNTSLLDAARGRVASDWRANPERESADGVEAQLDAVVELIEAARDGETAPDVTGEATALRLRLVDRIRRELLAEPRGEDVDDADLLGLLRSLEAIREVLEADWTRRFGLVLAGPHGVDVAAEIAHGLRSSCTSLLFVAEVLREGMYGELNDKQRQQVEVLYGAAVSLTSSLSDITELSWRTEEPGEAEPDAFSLEETANSILHLLEPVATAKGAEVGVEVQASAVRRGHSRALRQALLNLVLHAVLAAEGGSVSVRIGEDEDEERVDFHVRATGGELEELEDEDRFRILRQAVDGDYSFSTEGLRLHVARHLVRALGGELEHTVEDGGQHSSFTLRLPAHGEAEATG